MVRIFGYTILLCLGWTKTRISIKIQKSEVSSKITNLSFWVIKMKSLGEFVKNNWSENRKFVIEKIAILLRDYVQDVVNSTTTTFPYCPYNPYWELSVQWLSPCESRRVSLLLWFEVCEGKRIETGWKMVEKCQGLLLQRNLPRKHNITLLLFPIFEKFVLWCFLATPPFGGVAITSYLPKKTGCWRRIVLKEDLVAEDKPKLGATWPRLLLEVWSCGRVVGNGTEETVIPNGVLTVQMVGFG